jgi:hypothetical protein
LEARILFFLALLIFHLFDMKDKEP